MLQMYDLYDVLFHEIEGTLKFLSQTDLPTCY